MISLDAEDFVVRTCTGKEVAVVGSGPLLPNVGEEIDSHSIVIRINNFDLRSNTQNTGSRISLWVHNGHLGCTLPIISTVPHIVTKAYGGHLKPYFDEMYIHHGEPEMYFFNKEKVRELNTIVEPKKLTTGGRILAFLLQQGSVIPKISIYGFSFYDNRFPPYEDSSRSEFPSESLAKWHNPDLEREFFLCQDFSNLHVRLVI